MRKVISILLLAVAVSILLAGCGKAKEKVSDDPSKKVVESTNGKDSRNEKWPAEMPKDLPVFNGKITKVERNVKLGSVTFSAIVYAEIDKDPNKAKEITRAYVKDIVNAGYEVQTDAIGEGMGASLKKGDIGIGVGAKDGLMEINCRKLN